MIIELPWPHKDLSPNSRKHWSARARQARIARNAARILTLAALKAPASAIALRDLCAARLQISLQFTPDANRHYDLDGLISRMKSSLDGIADALNVNDRRFAFWKIELLPAAKPAKVIVTIEVLDV